jgi:hypothetical protein
MTEGGEFVEFDPLARFGGDRNLVRAKLLASNQIEVLMEDMGINYPPAAALLEMPVGDVALEDLEAKVAKLRRMADDPVIKALPRIREMGREEIEKTHAAGQAAYVSGGHGGIVRIDPDGTRHIVRQP